MPWWESVRMIQQADQDWPQVFELLDGHLAKRFAMKRNVINEAAE
jgi:hypothetical protein